MIEHKEFLNLIRKMDADELLNTISEAHTGKNQEDYMPVSIIEDAELALAAFINAAKEAE